MFATWMTRLWPKWCAMISRGPLALPRKACRHLSFLFFFGDHEFMILKKIIIIIINKKKGQVCGVGPKIVKLKPISLSQNKNEKEKLPLLFAYLFRFPRHEPIENIDY